VKEVDVSGEMTQEQKYDEVERRSLEDPHFFWWLLNDPESALRDMGLTPEDDAWAWVMDALNKTVGEGKGGAKSWLHGLRVIGAWRR
jgi:hypothetical protein